MISDLCPAQAGQDAPAITTQNHVSSANMPPDPTQGASARALFSLGQVVATPPAIAELKRKKLSVLSFLWRHQSGDWSAMNAEDAATNRQALTNGARIFSSFVCGDLTLWVITEADRSSTCVLLPSCY